MKQVTEQYPHDGVDFMRRAVITAWILFGLFAFALVVAALRAAGVA